MKVMVVGQKWLGEAVAARLAGAGHQLLAVAAPRLDDRLAVAGARLGADVVMVGRALPETSVPPDTDLIVCAHAHCFVGGAARGRARLGAIGYHPSLLPRHRGRDAIEWAVRFGDPVTGGTVYQLDDGADTGPILRQAWCWVRPGDTAAELWRRDLGPLGVKLLAETVDALFFGAVRPKPQDPALATFEPAIDTPRLAALRP